MPGARRRGVLPRRRRRDDDGEDESSAAGDIDELSLSEGSAISNVEDDADVEGSEISADDEETRESTAGAKKNLKSASNRGSRTLRSSDVNHQLDTSRDLETPAVTANGHAQTEQGNGNEQGQTEVAHIVDRVENEVTMGTPQLPESASDRARREHQEYVRQKNSNPAFVPNRGGFFLHDDRTAAPSSPYGRSYQRGRGRGYNNSFGVGRGANQGVSGPTDRPWSHDLHDTLNKSVAFPPVRDAPAPFHIPTAKPASIAPNRTFSISTVLGNVTVHVALPGMDGKKTFQNVVKKQHTLLPQHRPPLRRDKPVRISIPDEDPRYIFPSAERSFIFIPRAMRPNQQVYSRGRGRGSFQGSRRPSFMGSAYTPSVAMSRRSSLGVGSNGLVTPTEGVIPRGPLSQTFNRPIVRMPGSMNQAQQIVMPAYPTALEYGAPGPMMLHSPPVALPMHQPRPQKTVSVAGIESPAFKAPQQQQEQPFHQQMPPGVSLADMSASPNRPVQPGSAINAPLSHIPEGAVYAQPFQPYPAYAQGGYYGPAYAGGPVVFHAPTDPYGMGMGGPVMPQPFVHGPQNFVAPVQNNERGTQPGPMAHESHGMVFYYDPVQFPTDGSQMAQYPLAVGGGMVGVPAPGPYFYPAMPGGMYYNPTTQ